MNVSDFMSWAYEGHTTLKLVWNELQKHFQVPQMT